MSSYDPSEAGRQPKMRGLLNWLAYWKPVKVCVIDENGDAHTVPIDNKMAKRWNACAQTIHGLNGCSVRALDNMGNVLATMVIRTVEVEGERRAVESPATNQGVDIAAIVNTVAGAVVSAVKDTMSAMSDAHKQSFVELVNLARQSNERAMTLEKDRDRLMTERADRIEEEEERIEEERERIQVEREEEKENNKEMKEFMTPILQAAAPEVAKKIMGAFTSNGAAKDVAAKTAEKLVTKKPPPAPETPPGGESAA